MVPEGAGITVPKLPVFSVPSKLPVGLLRTFVPLVFTPIKLTLTPGEIVPDVDVVEVVESAFVILGKKRKEGKKKIAKDNKRLLFVKVLSCY